MKILIAPWGDPAGWKEATYLFNSKEIKSSSSLKILQDVISPKKTIILASDTLAQEGTYYERIKESAKEKVEKYAKNFGINDFKTIVLPGIGHFQDRNTKKEVHFYGNPQDYYYSLVYNLIQTFLENQIDSLEVHLDITHGVNYMPVLTYRALREILSNLSIYFDVTLYVYNTDPAQPFNLLEKTKVNIIEDSKIMPIPFREKANNNELIDVSNLDNAEKGKINRKLSSLTDKSITYNSISAFIGSIYNGLPLGIYTFFPEMDKLNNYIKENYKAFENNVNIETENNKLIVKRNIALKDNFKVFSFCILNASLISKIIEFPIKEVLLTNLKNLNEKLFKFDKRLKVVIDKELFNLKKMLEDNKNLDWKPLNFILNNEDRTEIDERNFLAHAGFERNAVEVKKENEKILFRYKEELLKKKAIYEFCQSGLL